MLLYSTGMRLSEIAALKITDIDSKNMRINYIVHTIRHSFATHLVDHGTDLHTVKELLGHSNLQTTMRYMHLTTTRIRGIINPYDALPQGKENTSASLKKIK